MKLVIEQTDYNEIARAIWCEGQGEQTITRIGSPCGDIEICFTWNDTYIILWELTATSKIALEYDEDALNKYIVEYIKLKKVKHLQV
jgi:hypothetical protein